MVYTYEIGRTLNRKADTETWEVSVIGSRWEFADEEIERRYPSDKGYTYRRIQMHIGIPITPPELVFECQ